MKTILARNIDSKFWDIEFLAVDILKSIEKTGRAIVHFNLEGPAFLETNLYQLFVYLKNVHKVDLSNITIFTGNLVEDTNKEYQVKIHPEWIYDFKSIQSMLPRYFSAAEKDNNAKSFGIFVSRSNYPRLALAGHMFSNHNENTLLTYHYDSSSDYHKSHLGLEELIHKFNPTSTIVKDAINLIQLSPILIEKNQKYPLSHPECYKILSWYNKFYIEIICETYFKGNTFYPTEKTWRALAMKTPFVVQGPNNYLKRLRDIGFKTFSDWWDESYDEDSYDYKLTAIIRIINEINNLDIKNIYKEMTPVLEHNHKLFKELDFKTFNKILNE